ncbi:MAG: ferrous iron transport protein B [Syntrophaceticus sp.]|nr:ferrous iron transport protein B [Syntrophaceticus sp.]MDD4783329.1 ferrous iron transport protein B [Syntrophaceticus sp.]
MTAENKATGDGVIHNKVNQAWELTVGVIGNPNSGKTTLFNSYTGTRLKVANWPGVTVEKKQGAFKYHNHVYKLVDLPGIYSLTPYSIEEKISRQFILSDDVDVIVDIADASNLERSLYLTLQLIEIGKPVVLALNMMDIVEERGMEIDLHRLHEVLGIPVIPVSARKKTGLDVLMHVVSHHQEIKSKSNHVVVYSDLIEDKITKVTERLREDNPDIYNPRFYAIKLLENDTEIMENCPVDVSGIVDKSYETEIINQKYDFIERLVEEVLLNIQEKAQFTDKLDSVLTHRIWGIPIFFGIMGLVFFLTFTLGDGIKGILEGWLESLSIWTAGGLSTLNAGPILTSLIADGIIAGVGTILTFLPNIAILFLALAFLEDSGYMARVTYVMNGVMNKIGLSGRAFIPMLLGFGCTVPAIMATRTLENERDRRKTILITPFMSCSAKIPVYVLLSGMFFGNYATLAALSMYIIGLVAGLFTAFVATKIENKADQLKASDVKPEVNQLLIELPEYKSPNVYSVLLYVWENVKAYLSKAGTIIFLACVVLWFILSFGTTGYVEDMSQSFGAIIGRFLVPILEPAGLGFWQIGVSLIAGLAAKEVVVSSMGIMFGIINIDSALGLSAMHQTLGAMGFGALNAYSMMIFVLFYTPCVAALAITAQELKSAKWTTFVFMFQLVFAWLASVLVYQIVSLFI